MRILLILMLSISCSCGGASNANVSVSQEQNPQRENEQNKCERNCAINCKFSGGYFYQVLCGKEVLFVGEAVSPSELPSECLSGEVPSC